MLSTAARLQHIWFPRPLVVTWIMEINRNSSFSRAMDPDKALSISWGPDIAMALVAVGHGQYGCGGSMARGRQHGVMWLIDPGHLCGLWLKHRTRMSTQIAIWAFKIGKKIVTIVAKFPNSLLKERDLEIILVRNKITYLLRRMKLFCSFPNNMPTLSEIFKFFPHSAPQPDSTLSVRYWVWAPCHFHYKLKKIWFIGGCKLDAMLVRVL